MKDATASFFGSAWAAAQAISPAAPAGPAFPIPQGNISVDKRHPDACFMCNLSHTSAGLRQTSASLRRPGPAMRTSLFQAWLRLKNSRLTSIFVIYMLSKCACIFVI
ncbi:hypothetical protein [Janthinobacterium agaricidamnosum]|uniref:hypothetical protein n=1 Tax=Janthinobacterium agaricidamnosum TaxID=55508 RepID=UPI001184D022|nr:hypothetical protein [Janthinobacterium agaricidamnosum]